MGVQELICLYAASRLSKFMHPSLLIRRLSVVIFINSFQVELEDPVENIGAKLVRQAAAKTNDLAGDGTTTSVVLAQGIIAEGVKVCLVDFA